MKWLALQGVGLMAEYCAQCAKQYGMSNGFMSIKHKNIDI